MKQVPVIDFNPFDGVFLDLDGVFADFDGKFFEITGMWPREVSTNKLWKIINAQDQYFYSLGLMKDAEHLWNYVKQFNPTFLTGLPSSKTGKQQKERWVAEKFGSEWPVIILPKRDKQLHSGPNKILIDDTSINITQWVDKGGHGIFHEGDVWETIENIESLRKAYL